MAITGPSTHYLVTNPGFSPYPQMSVGAWIKMAASATGANIYFLVGSDSSGDSQFNLHFAGTPTPNIFGSMAKCVNGTTIDGTAATQTPNPTNWHMVVATFDNGGTAGNVQTIRIYIDGALNNTITAGGPVTALVNNDAASYDYIFTGSVDGGGTVDYTMIWKRLLAASDVTALWNGGAGADPRTVASANLASFVSLNQSGTIPDLVSSMQWVPTGTGAFTVVAPPFTLGSPQPVMSTVPWWFHRRAKLGIT